MTIGHVHSTVFISYARADTGDLAARLHADLAARGFPAWIDTSAIAGGASWTKEIERAIDGCQSTLALVSHASFRSSVCRAEQLRALRKGKPVVPLLAQRDADRPLYLEYLNYRDLSDPSTYEAVLSPLSTEWLQSAGKDRFSGLPLFLSIVRSRCHHQRGLPSQLALHADHEATTDNNRRLVESRETMSRIDPLQRRPAQGVEAKPSDTTVPGIVCGELDQPS
jgi:hypothetical protein